MRPPRLVLLAARWAIMSGLAGTVFAALVFTDADASQSHDGLLLASAAFLSIAFILAPFVRRGYASKPVPRRKPARRTLLDEMRAEGDDAASAPVEPETRLSTAGRLLIALYVVFAVALVWVLGRLGSLQA